LALAAAGKFVWMDGESRPILRQDRVIPLGRSKLRQSPATIVNNGVQVPQPSRWLKR
jgi:hypothetical protein